MMRLFILFFFSYTLLSATDIHGYLFNSVTQQPIADAKIFSMDHETLSDQNGSFTIDSNLTETLHVKAYGYWPYKFSPQKQDALYLLKPIHVKALYLSFWSESLHSSRFQKILRLRQEGKINAVVIDIKNSAGYTSYKTECEQANTMGAYKYKMIKNISHFMQVMKQNDIYTIARIDVFKDALRAENEMRLALVDENASAPKVKPTWLDPFNKDAYPYVLCIAKDAARQGFDEINFDYVRFPAIPTMNYSKENTQQNRTRAIADFLKQAKHELRRYGVFISADIFGNVLWASDDSNIGQTIDLLGRYVDYLSPMLYPSGFSAGSFSFEDPAAHPYDVVFRSLAHAQKNIEAIRLRPWLQSFRDYAFNRQPYDKKQIQLQIKACDDANSSGWMFWNPSSRYDGKNFIRVNAK